MSKLYVKRTRSFEPDYVLHVSSPDSPISREITSSKHDMYIELDPLMAWDVKGVTDLDLPEVVLLHIPKDPLDRVPIQGNIGLDNVTDNGFSGTPQVDLKDLIMSLPTRGKS